MNNAYHQFKRLPKGVVNAALFDLRASESPDALDVFEYLTNLTHHNSFESKMIYQSELKGIQRRLNRILIPHGYRLKCKSVPVGIQKAHKVADNEKRWGFEVISPRERLNALIRESPVSKMINRSKREEKEKRELERLEKLNPILEEIMTSKQIVGDVDISINDDLLTDFLSS
ncbi:conserved hypothetical protein [Vibrio crassostreae]|nr:conserved hypothetical protein [Vibrio crassostreae]